MSAWAFFIAVTDLFGSTTIMIAGGLFAVTMILAYVAFRLLKRSVRIAFRLALLAAIIVFGLTAAILFWWTSADPTQVTKPKPSPARKK
jgi:hypothetical protein